MGAASNKMAAVVRAMRGVNAKAYLFSLPVLGRDSSRKYVPSKLVRDRSVPQIFTSIVANPYLRKIHALFYFAAFCALKVRRNDRVILYNSALEYLLGALILAARGNRPISDIEDSARGDESGWHGWLGQTIYAIFSRLSSGRKLIVSHSLAKSLRLIEYCVVYGATDNDLLPLRNRRVAFTGVGNKSNPLTVHYGGSLSPDTGVDLFCSAVNILRQSDATEGSRIHFVVTGFGAENKLESLRKQCQGSGVEVSYFPRLSPQDYIEKFRQCHVALSLKLPSSEMAMTTFPSKVVDITSSGLLLIATDISDIPEMFDKDEAIMLREASANALAEAVIGVIEDPARSEWIAKNGQKKAFELFGSQSVGKRVVDFVLNDGNGL